MNKNSFVFGSFGCDSGHSGRVRGFTLIELLVVIAIIGLLSSIVFASFGGTRAKGRDARRVSDLREMAKEIAIVDKDPAVSFVGCTLLNAKVNSCTTPNLSKYSDPSAGTDGTACTQTSVATCQYSVSRNVGVAGATTQDFQICAYLESGVGTLSAGTVEVNSDGGIIQGCSLK